MIKIGPAAGNGKLGWRMALPVIEHHELPALPATPATSIGHRSAAPF